jgi:uncharacterized protein
MINWKNAGFGISDVDRKRSTVVGYASKFGNVDSHNDIVVKGAFTRTISHGIGRVKTLMHHDPVSIVGKPIVMREDEDGLYTETKVSDTAMGRDLLTLIEDQVIDEMSIGYITVQQDEDKARGVRYLREVKLIEYSFVTLASNPEARIQGVKSQSEVFDEVAGSMKRMERALRDGKFESDTLPERFEFALKYWRTVLDAHKAGVVENPSSVLFNDEASASPDEGTHSSEVASAETTQPSILDMLKYWNREHEVLSAIQAIGRSLERGTTWK